MASEAIDHFADGTPAATFGTVAIGRAVKIRVDGRTIMPDGPADRPAYRNPKL